MILTVDIETVPQARYVNPETFHNGGAQLAEKWYGEVARWNAVEADRMVKSGEAVLESTGVYPALHATTCHVVQVSFGWRDVGGVRQSKVVQRDEYAGDDWERTLVRDALDLVSRAAGKGTRLVSFNGKQFDLPLLRARAAILRVGPVHIPWRRLLYPYSDDQHADLRLVLGADNRFARGTLQVWADAFGIHAEEHGADVWRWVEAGEWDRLREYGQCEAQTLIELFDAVEAYL